MSAVTRDQEIGVALMALGTVMFTAALVMSGDQLILASAGGFITGAGICFYRRYRRDAALREISEPDTYGDDPTSGVTVVLMHTERPPRWLALLGAEPVHTVLRRMTLAEVSGGVRLAITDGVIRVMDDTGVIMTADLPPEAGQRRHQLGLILRSR